MQRYMVILFLPNFYAFFLNLFLTKSHKPLKNNNLKTKTLDCCVFLDILCHLFSYFCYPNSPHMVIHIISYIIAMLYICYIFRLWRAWKKAERFSFQTGLSSQKELVSIVVAFRNEEQHLAKLQNALAKQTYKNYELILVNDHSTDNFKSKISQERRIRLLNATEEGKKRALLEGVNAAKGDIVLCTDADCLPCPTWIESIVSFFGTNQTDMVIAPVVMIPEKKAFERIQTLEFASLQAATAGSACAGDPIMCNGANMAFKKK
ncbi:MAG: glycosyltransferase, partial [Bacteroidales bacterium]|nr:glycosyltransferase [Bacteroidales bacterium]